MLDILFEDVGFAVFVVSALLVLVALALWVYASISSVVLALVTFLFALACLGGLFKHLLDAAEGHEAL